MAVTELVGHVAGLPAPLPAAFLLVGLVPVAYAGLSAGFGSGALSSLVLGVYAVHFVGPHEALVVFRQDTLQAGFIVTLLGLGMAGPMAVVKRREDRLRKALRERAEELERRNRELTEANASLEAFGYVVSHDLKEPVRAVENYLEAALEEYGSPSGRDFTMTARDANRRLNRMLQGLLSYSQASAAVPRLRPTDVADVLAAEACRAQYEPLQRERQAMIDVEPGPSVLADEVVLSQMLGNLVLNAIRHDPKPQPRVRVTTRALDDERAEIVVADRGPGFPEDVLHRFATLRHGRPATVKGGFGLVIAHRAAQRMGGSLRLENGPEGGRVIVELQRGSQGPRARDVPLNASPS